MMATGASTLDAGNGVTAVVIGASWGGLAALTQVLSVLPRDYPLPIAVVQHRGRETYETLASVLQVKCELVIREAEDKMPFVAPGVYLAPADYHLLLEPGEPAHLALSTEEPVGFSRPSIDVLFDSAAATFGRHVLGVVLTGANRDGSVGLSCIHAAGGMSWVQDPQAAESPSMPGAALASVPSAVVLSLDAIGPALVRLVRARHPLSEPVTHA
jgi:two-component system chemotaxis response regulator CheB